MSSFDPIASAPAVATATDEAIEHLVNCAFAPLRVAPEQSFIEAGGHSLGVLELQHLLARDFDVAASYAELSRLATPRRIAAWVREAPRRVLRAALAPDRRLPATPAQAAIYAATRMHASPTAYNVPIAIELDRAIGTAPIRRSLITLVERHAALRATFVVDGDRLVQCIEPNARLPFSFQVVAPDQLDDALASFRQPFDLERGPLLRAALFDAGAPALTLLLDFHHLIVDGVSVELLLLEIGQLLEGGALTEPTDYAAALYDIRAARRPSVCWAAWPSPH